MERLNHRSKFEDVLVSFSEANGNCIVELEGFLSEKTNEAEYFEEACGEFEGKMQRSVQVSHIKLYFPEGGQSTT